MITISDKKNCCGCAACYSVCPKKAITMQEDEEGFLYPEIDPTHCINCGRCDKICPILNTTKETGMPKYGFVVQNKNEKILRESTSGGAFSALAEAIIERAGVVFGAALDRDTVYHIAVDSKEEMYKFRSSKYVQSAIRDTLLEAKTALSLGRTVLFSGTGCQIEGLKSFLGQEYENLITVDVVCRSVPSPKVFRKYLEYREGQYGEGLTVRFRDKTIYGYNYSNLSVRKDGKLLSHGGIESDPYLRAFFGGFCNRPSCAKCKFRKHSRVSDMTIWDCFDVRLFSKKMDDNRGATKVVVHTNKGYELIRDCLEKLNYVEISPENLFASSDIRSAPKDSPLRAKFMTDVDQLQPSALFNKYFRPTIKTRLISLTKVVLVKTGLYSKLKSNKMKKFKRT